MKFSTKNFFSKCDQILKFFADLVTFTEEIFNGKLHFLCSDNNNRKNDNKQIFHAFLFNVRNYSPEVINIQRHEAELNIILPRVNNFDIKQKRHGVFVLLFATNTKQDLVR